VAKGHETCEVGLINGDFSHDLTAWTTSATGSGSVSINDSLSYGCLPSQTGNKFAFIAAYSGTGTLSQEFRVPAGSQILTLRAWNNLDPTTATISIVSGGQETVLDTFIPPSMQGLSNPNDYFSVICTGNAPASLSLPIAAFAGMKVTLRLTGSYISGVNGTFMSFDDVAIH